MSKLSCLESDSKTIYRLQSQVYAFKGLYERASMDLAEANAHLVEQQSELERLKKKMTSEGVQWPSSATYAID